MKKLLAGLAALLWGTSACAVTLDVVTDDNLPPYSFVQKGGVIGIDVDMLLSAAKTANVEIRLLALPWKRVLFQVEHGTAHLAMPLFRTPERETFATFLAPVHFSATGLFVQKGKEFRFDSVNDLFGKAIGYNRGFALNEQLDRAIRNGKIRAEEVSTTEQNIKKLLASRVDAFVANIVNTQFLLKSTPDATRVTVLPNYLAERRPAYLVAAKAPRTPEQERAIAALSGALDRLSRDGTYERIVKKYTE